MQTINLSEYTINIKAIAYIYWNEGNAGHIRIVFNNGKELFFNQALGDAEILKSWKEYLESNQQG